MEKNATGWLGEMTGGEYREIKIAVTMTNIQHWHRGWLRAADAERADDYYDWLLRDLKDAVYKAVLAFIARHPDEFACEPDVI